MKSIDTILLQVIAEKLAADEVGHVAFLRNKLGRNALPLPLLDIGGAFSSFLNQGAESITLNPAFL